MLHRLSTSIILAIAAALTCSAQSPAPPPPSSQPPNPAAAQKPTSPPSSQPAKKDAKPPKKVWTNEDLANLTPGGVSVVGEARQQKPAAAPAAAKSSEMARIAASYRQQLAKLQAELDQVDKKIAALHNFTASNASPGGGLNMMGYYNATPVADQLQQLETLKKRIQARIDAIEDDARHKGIPPGDLR
jgi:hypothetical protein